MKLKRVLPVAVVISSLAGAAQANVLEKTNVKFSGYIKADAMFSSYSDGTLSSGSIGRDFYIPSLTPTGGTEESTQFDAHIKQSRFRFTTDTALANGKKLSGVLEFDFHATAGGDERISNSYTPRIRHAFIKYDNWLIGQTWSTFQDVRALPESVDFIGVTDGTIFVRQMMVRYTSGNFEIAAENPESTISNYQASGRIVSDDNAFPDITARYTFKGDWGHFAVAGLARQLSYINKQDGTDIDTSETSMGLSLTAKFKLGQDDIRLMANTGKGLGRYLGLNVANGAILNEDNELEAIDSTGFTVAYRHIWNEKFRSNFMYSAFNADNDMSLNGSIDPIKSTLSARVNLMYSPTKELTLGGEYAYAKKELESGSDGTMGRIQLTAKYAF
ncbi:DcaP family trimeric outer membrane transporter [Paraglaciecola marina]|uniref:DcaP family trimeric outer membrane transporter n=1 Tax=Paraglaciecola marina TaxID=2500157 RepID=UPI001414EDCC|nr:DcaP family trimeric outer membrane transporter [Paraglaciecola marina]